jgi:hypothetical protein
MLRQTRIAAKKLGNCVLKKTELPNKKSLANLTSKLLRNFLAALQELEEKKKDGMSRRGKQVTAAGRKGARSPRGLKRSKPVS